MAPKNPRPIRPVLFAILALAFAVVQSGFAQAQTVPRPPSSVSPDLGKPWMKKATQKTAVQKQKQRASLFKKKQRTRGVAPQFLPQAVRYNGKEAAGTIIIDTNERFLYLILSGGKAKRYGVGVGRPGFEWAGRHTVTRKAEWPDWTPPAEMVQREAERGRILPASMKGGPSNPLGARALYLGDTLYRIHGSNEPWTIGHAVSSGCIRMRNEDVIDLYGRVGVGTKVLVR
jgi:lipoprotein-anchoring transpeptidase ErfK/SrfK